MSRLERAMVRGAEWLTARAARSDTWEAIVYGGQMAGFDTLPYIGYETDFTNENWCSVKGVWLPVPPWPALYPKVASVPVEPDALREYIDTVQIGVAWQLTGRIAMTGWLSESQAEGIASAGAYQMLLGGGALTTALVRPSSEGSVEALPVLADEVLTTSPRRSERQSHIPMY